MTGTKPTVVLFFVLFLCFTLHLNAQIAESDLLLTEARQSDYVKWDAITKSKIISLRETMYYPDKTTGKVDMKKPDLITLLGIYYLGDIAMPTEEMVANGSDTTKLTAHTIWGYYNTGQLLKYESTTEGGWKEPTTIKIVLERDVSGAITKFSYSNNNDFKNQPPGREHRPKCQVKNGFLGYAKDRYVDDGKDMEIEHTYNYDSNNNLISAYNNLAKKVNDPSVKTQGLWLYDNTYKYDNTNHLVEKNDIVYYTQSDFIAASDTVFGYSGLGTKYLKELPHADIPKKISKDESNYTYKYDAQQRLVKLTCTRNYDDNLNDEKKATTATHWEEYTYNSEGIPEFIKSYNSGGLEWVKKLVCTK